ncbi:MAG: esterase-like activity of phytase family protein [Leptolyngbyaceae cyanobacterium bins.302]|nr:esterase-like activity of phytase family protein [Leptolyngbyaceae cyanobacterium bins.302]
MVNGEDLIKPMRDRKFRPGTWLALLVMILMPLLTGCDLPQVSAEERIFLNLNLDFLGEYQLPKQKFQDTPVGGLSGITYDRQRNLFYVVSDDRSDFAPARFYTLKMALDSSNPKAPKIQKIDIQSVTTITNEDGKPYPKGEVDPEGIALSPLGTLFISSEGIAPKEIPPFVREFELQTGQWKRNLVIPKRYAPKLEQSKLVQGVGDNLGFEALTLGGISPGAIEPFRLFTATESALTQDASPDHPQQGASRNRWLHYSIDPDHSLLVSEQLYPMETPPEGALYHGLTEILAIDQGGHFLSLERSFGANGFSVKLFQLSIGSATDTSKIETFRGALPGVQPIRKKLLLDLTQLGIPLDNLEGMTLGPQLPDGSPSLILISDDNFNPKQVSQVLLFRFRKGA